MKITGPPISLPQTSGTGLLARGRKPDSVEAKMVAEPALGASASAQAGARPVRISRFPGEAALFAYDRQARVVEQVKAQIDEYV